MLSILVATYALPLRSHGARRVAEGLVLFAWAGGALQLYVYTRNYNVAGGAVPWKTLTVTMYNAALLSFQLCGPMPSISLCWGHMNWDVMRFL